MPQPNTCSIEPPVIERFLSPIRAFMHVEASSGFTLMAFLAVALAWANSPLASLYDALWAAHLTVGVGEAVLSKPLILWINDGLMAIFFFLVGLEIKREVLVGELNSVRAAALPVVAAIGGMVVPALFFAAFNLGRPTIDGWGIPMATDIAFALGILALLGDRVPTSLKVFLTAVAIVDDIGAVLVIALFYTSHISMMYLLIAAVLVGAMVVLNLMGVRAAPVYLLVGIVVWFFVLKSGVHATIAGVVCAMTIPARTPCRNLDFASWARLLINRYEKSYDPNKSILTNKKQFEALHELQVACHKADAPIIRLEHALHPWVAFAVMPIFALANAGVHISADIMPELGSPLALGIIVGLLAGKQIGVTLGSLLAIRAGWAEMPHGMSLRHLYGVGWLAGIGFTMSIFIANLALADQPAEALDVAKLGILCASLLAGVVGFVILRNAPPVSDEEPMADVPSGYEQTEKA